MNELVYTSMTAALKGFSAAFLKAISTRETPTAIFRR